MSNLTKLKIKIKHLALEPAIIKHEEQKCLKRAHYLSKKHQIVGEFGPVDYYTLRDHRILHVRPEARATQLVYAFLRGKRYIDTETTRPMRINVAKGHNSWWYACKEADIIKRMSRMIYKYGEDKVPLLNLKELQDRLGVEKVREMNYTERNDWNKNNTIPEAIKNWIENDDE